MKQIHTIPPVFDENSKILILGSFPSVKSREQCFYYGHVQNRFWKVLAQVYSSETPESISEKRAFLLSHRIALWDVIESCDIIGSSDSSISCVVANNIDSVISQSNINKIYLNGKTSEKLYNKYIYPSTKIKGIYLPSTSPANASFSLDKLVDAWKTIL